MPSLWRFKSKVIFLQARIRRFLAAKRLKYIQFSEYLAMKSKKIMLNVKHFYKINAKFDLMRNYRP